MAFETRARRVTHRVTFVFFCLIAAVALYWVTLPSAEALRRSNPASTALMDARIREARQQGRAARKNQHWVPLNRISLWLVRAVVHSEDARFFDHEGIDVEQTRIALTSAVEDGHFGRGASTITQQLAKNLWLGEERTLWRKVRELVLAHRLESLGKTRVLELYLNVVEWGDGVYGADAASRVWFQKPAEDLLPEEAAVLAAMLPAPRKRIPSRPSPALRKRAHEILSLYWTYGELSPEELAAARWRLREILAGRRS
jgi:monofunctional biosynthetic peptidoglycan transglycosylase